MKSAKLRKFVVASFTVLLKSNGRVANGGNTLRRKAHIIFCSPRVPLSHRYFIQSFTSIQKILNDNLGGVIKKIIKRKKRKYDC